MTKFEKRILLAITLLIIVLTVLEAMVPEPIDWRPSYSRNHTKPLGSALVYDRLVDLFPEVTAENRPYGEEIQSNYDPEYNAMEFHKPVNRIFINSYLNFEPHIAEELLTKTYMGDHIFLAAESISGSLRDSLKITMRNLGFLAKGDTGDVRAIGSPRIAEGVYRYVRGTSGSYFTAYDTVRTRVLAVNGRSEPVLLEIAYGTGRFVVCSMPDAFTNFNLLKNNNAEFMAGAFSILPRWPVIWYEFYKARNDESQTPLRYLLSQTALRWAWYLAIALVVLYIAVFARRQQRAIPIIAPPKNATRELAGTIGRLYWHKGDHGDLGRKMIALFKDDVRQRTYLSVFTYDTGTIQHLSTKTGRTVEEISDRLGAIERYEKSTRLSELQLKQLSNELFEFRQLIR